MQTAREALAALSLRTNYERTRPDGPRAFSLERPRRLLEALGSPHHALGSRVVQVAGSKGKGSVVRFLDSIFRGAGIRTGRYLSPHLESVLERFVIDGEPVPEAAFAAAVERTLSLAEPGVTFFEALTSAACLLFAEAGVEATLLEVGLGGRLDATTVVPTTANVITSIGLEHTDILGDTLAAIAGEKAATIRDRVPVWCGVDPASEAGCVIERVAQERGAPLYSVPEPLDSVATPEGVRWGGVLLPLIGRHQAHNAALAAAVAHDLPAEIVRAGLERAEQPGCCERRGERPTVLLDGAHTEESVKATLRAVSEHFFGRAPHVVFALGADKRLGAIAAALAAAAATIHCCQVDLQRGRTAEELLAALGAKARVWPDAISAFEAAKGAAGAEGVVLVTGSLYLVGALR